MTDLPDLAADCYAVPADSFLRLLPVLRRWIDSVFPQQPPRNNPESLALISFGSNLGNQNEIWNQTLDLISKDSDIAIDATSSLFSTKPIGGPEGQNDFVNAAAVIKTVLRPKSLVDRLLELEEQMGRVRVQRWGSRMVDLDLLLFQNEEIQSDRCQVPHPRMTFRKFMMIPASEVAGDWVHPVSGYRIDQLLTMLDCPDRQIHCIFSEEEGETGNADVWNLIKELAESGGYQSKKLRSDQFLRSTEDLSANLTIFLGDQALAACRKRSFGPYLRLSGQDLQFDEVELMAAFDAMKSL